MARNKKKTLVVLATGGSNTDSIGYTTAQLDVAELIQAMPCLAELPYTLVCERVGQFYSRDMSFDVWQRLLSRAAHWLAVPEVQGVVITHGTDTLEETAFYLHCALPRPLLASKPVVFTYAMRPVTALNADGPQNIRDAITVALMPRACGVLAVCAGAVHSAAHLQKVHPYRLDAFNSGDAGPLGYVEEGAVRMLKQWFLRPVGALASEHHSQKAINNIASSMRWPRVEILMNYAGAGALTVDALLVQLASQQGAALRGIVVAGTGNGTVHEELEAALLRAQACIVAVRRSTRCAMGQLILAPNAALPHSEGLSPVKARIALMLELMASD